MFSFLNPKIESFGIDLSDLSIKIVDLKRKGKGDFLLSAFGRSEIQPGLIENGEIKQEEALIEVIKKSLREIKGEPLHKYCFASLPETVAFVRLLQLPLMEKSEVAEAIKWEIEVNVPLSRSEIYYDWQVLPPLAGTSPQYLDVLVGVLPKKTVDPYLNVFKKAGLKPISFEIESIALSRALIKDARAGNAQLIIDFGAQRTSIAIFSGQAVCFTSSFSISNHSLVAAISEKMGLDFEKAKQIKIEKGLNPQTEENPAFVAMREPLQELAGKIKGYINFFEEHSAAQFKAVISKAILCGGGANLTGLVEFLAKELKMEIEIGNPWVNVLKNPRVASINGLSFNDSLSFTTAIGLALEGMEEE